MAIVETFRKGQLVPKRLGVVDVHKKARHLITFGMDVMVTITPGERQVKFEEIGTEKGAALLRLPSKWYIKHSNGTKQLVDAVIKNIHFIAEPRNKSTFTSYALRSFSLPKDLNNPFYKDII